MKATRLLLALALLILPFAAIAQQSSPPVFSFGPDGTFGGAGVFLPKTHNAPKDSSACLTTKLARYRLSSQLSVDFDAFTGMEFNHTAGSIGYGPSLDWSPFKPGAALQGFIDVGVCNLYSQGSQGRFGGFLGIFIKGNSGSVQTGAVMIGPR